MYAKNPLDTLVSGFFNSQVECGTTLENGTALAVVGQSGLWWLISNHTYQGESIGFVSNGEILMHQFLAPWEPALKVERQGYAIASFFQRSDVLASYKAATARLTLTPTEIQARRQVKKAWEAAVKAQRPLNTISGDFENVNGALVSSLNYEMRAA